MTVSLGWQGKRSILGLALGLTALVSCTLVFSFPAGLILGAAYAFLGCFRLDVRSNWIPALAWSLGMMLLLTVTGPLMVRAFGLFKMGLWKVILNLACCWMVLCLVTAVTGRLRVAVIVTAILMQIFATVNAYVFLFRSRELAASDIFSASTALSVMNQYVFALTPEILGSWLVWGLGLFAGWCMGSFPAEKPRKTRIAAACGGLALGLLLHFGSLPIRRLTWGRDGSRLNGLYLNFYLGLRDIRVKKPRNYDPQAVLQWQEQYAVREEPGRRPNIIVIMNEAWADLGVFPEELRTNIPVTPFLDSLEENVIRGYALSSVYGGNTASSEFEFLTGHSMAFLPDSAVPYQQYVKDNIYSLPWYLRSLGYTCKATHSYYGQGWARDITYPYLGFSESAFLESYPGKDLVRNYISDREQYGYMLETLQKTDAPVFLFGVTMQNHGGYTYAGENYTQTVFLQGYDRAYPEAEQYLTLLNQSDQALEALLTALADDPQDTVVLMFGDHFPKIEDGFYEELNGGPLDTLDEKMRQYQVPYLIWANFPLEGQGSTTSLNYLANHLLDAAGVEKNGYYRFLSDLEAEIPAMNALGYYSAEKQGYVPYGKSSPELLLRYQYLQYNDLFDEENRNELFFGQYIP